jgi:drug/metabolite transporter (DMT)-like permease
VSPVSIGTITYLEPVTGVLIGTFLLNEILTGLQVVGFVLVLSVGFLQVYLDSK